MNIRLTALVFLGFSSLSSPVLALSAACNAVNADWGIFSITTGEGHGLPVPYSGFEKGEIIRYEAEAAGMNAIHYDQASLIVMVDGDPSRSITSTGAPFFGSGSIPVDEDTSLILFAAAPLDVPAYVTGFVECMVPSSGPVDEPTEPAPEVESKVSSFSAARFNLISSTIEVPNLLVRRSGGVDDVFGSVTPLANGMALAFAANLGRLEIPATDARPGPSRFDIWIDGIAMAHTRTQGNRWGTFGVLSAGADYLVSDRALVGVSFHLDHMRDPLDGDTTLDGEGWLFGPYGSFELGNGVFLDTRLLYGGSRNTIDTGGYEGDFETRRWLWDAALSGQWELDQMTTLTPKLRVLYLSEAIAAYEVTNAAGTVLSLSGETQRQFRASMGAEVERRFVLDNGLLLSPNLGVTGGLGGNGAFAALTTGLSLTDEENWSMNAALRFDVEENGWMGAGATVGVKVTF